MRIAFRVDASLQSGSGHVMRCLTLADGLREREVDVFFICREHPGHLIEQIVGRGYVVSRLPVPHADGAALAWNRHAAWLGVKQAQDAVETLEAVGAGGRCDWLIVDHYALDRRWQAQLRAAVDSIMIIDDLADRGHDCDLLLDQNLYPGQERRYAGLVPANCVQLLGPRYALLRPEFAAARSCCAPACGDVGRMLVFLGGSDPGNAAGTVIEALRRLARPDLAVDLVVGPRAIHRDALLAVCRRLPQVVWHENVTDMAALMARANLAIGAAGTTTWERCCLGLPALIVSIAENQVAIARAIAQQGAALYLGPADQVAPEAILDALEGLLRDSSRLAAMSVASRQLVDGYGTQRVVAQLERRV